jgi:hypothetical protein
MTQRLESMNLSAALIHSALQTASHLPQDIQLSIKAGLMSGERETHPKITPTGHMVLQNSLPLQKAAKNTKTSIAIGIKLKLPGE